MGTSWVQSDGRMASSDKEMLAHSAGNNQRVLHDQTLKHIYARSPTQQTAYFLHYLCESKDQRKVSHAFLYI